MATVAERLAILEEKVDSLEKRMQGNRQWLWWLIGTLTQIGILLAALWRR